MKASRRPFTCIQCLLLRPQGLGVRQFHCSPAFRSTVDPAAAAAAATAPPPPGRPSVAPKPVIDIKHIRQNPTLYEQNCLERNYKAQAAYPARIIQLFDQWQARQRQGRSLRERSNLLRRELANPPTTRDDHDPALQELRARSRDDLLAEARDLKARLADIEADEDRLTDEMQRLAVAIPNLTSTATPRGPDPLVLSYINDHPEDHPDASDRVWRSHVHIGAELGLLDFAGAAATSGWGWYFLLNEAAQLEQALVSYALAAATRAGWAQVSAPSVVYAHIADACGYRPRDANGEQQIYALAPPLRPDSSNPTNRPEHVLAGTAEIPLAGMKADTTLEEPDLPLRRVAVSRCFRAEAGARGADTKGLYRVHEFTKVELFAWTAPSESAATELFDEMLDLQTDLLQSLGLHCRVLEMPSQDLGASAWRKCDIEAFFPSRRDRNDGWGEVTSASICTDYQTRRLATRARLGATGGKLAYPWTVNGTALAVPRVLAALLENGWDESSMTVAVPEVLRPWMGGLEKIGGRHHLRTASRP
ncbi:hypothetical protein VTK73DRAFT_1162 [Phialemonium thermophilum]|uniref:serine--tRNA ligase n=1 Tax=Phialemonium thermophilum TaxID=223376 RepID=A0ABR3XB71_9PEZI